MNLQEIKRQLGGHQWIFSNNRSQNIRMGAATGGILAIEFLEDGTLGSQSDMSFFPDTVKWKINLKEEKVELLDKDDQIIRSLNFPVVEHDQVILLDEKTHDKYSYHISTDAVLNLAVAPIPKISSDLSFLPQQEVNAVIQLGGDKKSRLAKSVLKSGLNFEMLKFDAYDRVNFQNLYDYLCKHAEFMKLIILDHEYKIINYPFDKVLPQRIYLDDVLEMIPYPDSQRFVQKLTPTALIGERAVILELLSTILNNYDFEVLSDKLFTNIIYQYFADRLIHGRLVSYKKGIKSNDSWILGKLEE